MSRYCRGATVIAIAAVFVSWAATARADSCVQIKQDWDYQMHKRKMPETWKRVLFCIPGLDCDAKCSDFDEYSEIQQQKRDVERQWVFECGGTFKTGSGVTINKTNFDSNWDKLLRADVEKRDEVCGAKKTDDDAGSGQHATQKAPGNPNQKPAQRAVATPTGLPAATDAGFDTLISGSVPVLVLFAADWCGPCRMVTPSLEALQAERQGRVRFAVLDVDANPKTANAQGVMNIPTLIIFKEGKTLSRQVGAVPQSKLAEWIDTTIGQHSEIGSPEPIQTALNDARPAK